MMINQGDIYWIALEAESAIPHPYVIVQDNLFNHSRIHTVVVCQLTTNLNRINLPGNVLLEAGEANLPKQSLVEVAKIVSVDKTRLGDYIGTLSPQRVEQVLAGLRFIQTAFLRE